MWLVLTVSIGVLVVSFLPAKQRTSGYLGGLAQGFGVGVAVECIFLAGLALMAGVFLVCAMLLAGVEV